MPRRLALFNLALPLVLLPACSRATRSSGDATSSAAPAATAQPRGAGSAPPTTTTTTTTTGAPAPSFACRLTGSAQTVDDGQGQSSPTGQSEVENARLIVDDATDTTIVTWERQSNFQMGDSYRVPMAATRSGGSAFRIVELPVDAYACATYGYLAANAGPDSVITWGVANTRGFELWRGVPRTTKDSVGRSVTVDHATRAVLTRKQEVHGFAVSRGFALATTTDGACDALCSCFDKPTTRGVWIYNLGKGSAVKLATAAPDAGLPDAPDAPAIAMSEAGGAAAYRSAKALWLVWLDLAGKPLGPPEPFDTGDVGAPALAVAGKSVTLVWARRAAKSEPYQLRILDVATRSALGTPRVLSTTKAAFAPAALADDASVVLAWMEGDAAKSGEIHLARVDRRSLATSAPGPTPLAGVVISGADEPNARDPELSGTPSAPAITWSTFTKARGGGVVRFARASCDAH